MKEILLHCIIWYLLKLRKNNYFMYFIAKHQVLTLLNTNQSNSMY